MESQHRVLVVDDDPITLDLMSRYLEQIGIQEVVVASSAVKALQLLETSVFDLAIIDIMMPTMNGYELTVLIRRKLGLVDMPVIAISSQGALESTDHAHEVGINLLVPKPMSLQKVRDILSQFLAEE